MTDRAAFTSVVGLLTLRQLDRLLGGEPKRHQMRRVLVANRGEIACRIMRSCRDLGLRTVAVYSDADANSLHVASADDAFAIGPAAARESYLKIDAILDAARKSGADAVHPGYGFLAENRSFAEAVMAAGLIWIGPDPGTIGDMGDKERARALAKSAGVPVLPGSARFAPEQLAGLEPAAEQLGFPLLVKASAGGGGIGMRVSTARRISLRRSRQHRLWRQRHSVTVPFIWKNSLRPRGMSKCRYSALATAARSISLSATVRFSAASRRS